MAGEENSLWEAWAACGAVIGAIAMVQRVEDQA